MLNGSESRVQSPTDDLWADVTPAPARVLLLAAMQAFAERGFHATTTRDIASRAAMSPAAVYTHYPTKEELLFRIAKVGHQRVVELFAQATHDVADPAERLATLVRTLSRWHAAQHTVARVIIDEMGALTPEHFAEINKLRKRIERTAYDTVAEGVNRSAFDVPEVAGTTRALLSLVSDIPRWFQHQSRWTPDQVAELYAELALRMVGCREQDKRHPSVHVRPGAA